MSFAVPMFLSLVLPLTVLVYWLSPVATRRWFLLAVSVLIYAWGEPLGVLVLMAIGIFNYLVALVISRNESGILLRRMMTGLGVSGDVAALVLFKYAPFWGGVLKSDTIAAWLLPMGLSYYVFQLISYLVDVHRHEIAADRDFANVLLYACFFPKMVSGPIVRYGAFVTDLCDRRFHRDDFCGGMRRFGIGLAKKVLIADMMTRIVDPIFALPPTAIPCAYCWLGAVAYAIQIYFDFSGYTDMAIGLGRIFGFQLPENFVFPSVSLSIREFWRRWHISLSCWFRDYLYIPLGGSRNGPVRTYVNLFAVFACCGVWHGASWTFLVWGLYHGAGLAFERLLGNRFPGRLPDWAARLIVQLFVLVGWVFFRSVTVGYAVSYVKGMFLGNPQAPYDSFVPVLQFFDYSGPIILILGILLSFPWAPALLNRLDEKVGSALSFVLLLTAVVFALTDTCGPGIYGRF